MPRVMSPNELAMLTHLPLDKMAAIREIHFRVWKVCILIKIPLKVIPKGPSDNNTALV